MTVSNPSDPRSERWIVWDSGFGEGQAAHVALCDRAGRCRWQHDWPDAYAPTIQYMGSWSTRQARIFLATYSQGAEAQTAVVIGLRKGQGPTLLAQEDGAWVAVAPQVNGLQVDTSSGLPVTMKCLRWDLSHRRFNDVRCR